MKQTKIMTFITAILLMVTFSAPSMAAPIVPPADSLQTAFFKKKGKKAPATDVAFFKKKKGKGSYTA